MSLFHILKLLRQPAECNVTNLLKCWYMKMYAIKQGYFWVRSKLCCALKCYFCYCYYCSCSPDCAMVCSLAAVSIFFLKLFYSPGLYVAPQWLSGKTLIMMLLAITIMKLQSQLLLLLLLFFLSLNLMHKILANDVYSRGLVSGIKIVIEYHKHHLLFKDVGIKCLRVLERLLYLTSI